MSFLFSWISAALISTLSINALRSFFSYSFLLKRLLPGNQFEYNDESTPPDLHPPPTLKRRSKIPLTEILETDDYWTLIIRIMVFLILYIPIESSHWEILTITHTCSKTAKDNLFKTYTSIGHDLPSLITQTSNGHRKITEERYWFLWSFFSWASEAPLYICT